MPAGETEYAVPPHLAARLGGGFVHGPVAGTGNVAGAAAFHVFERTALELVRGLVGRLHRGGCPGVTREPLCGELVIEALFGEIAALFGDPLLQPSVRLNDEFAHYLLLC